MQPQQSPASQLHQASVANRQWLTGFALKYLQKSLEIAHTYKDVLSEVRSQ